MFLVSRISYWLSQVPWYLPTVILCLLVTGVRDYIHVMDLASGHVAALKRLDSEHLQYKVGVARSSSGEMELLFRFLYTTLECYI